MTKHSRLLLLLGVICNTSLGGDIKCFVLQPPEKSLPGIHTIALLDFTGAHGRTISDYLTEALLENARGITTIRGGLFSKDVPGVTHQAGARTNVLTIVERSRLDQVLKEQTLGTSGLVTETQAAAIGKVLGVDAIVLGTITPVANDAFSKEEFRYYKDKKEYTVMEDCTTRKITLRATLRIVNSSSAEILGTKEGNASVEDKKCGDERAKMQSKEEMLTDCIRSIVRAQFAPYMAPTFAKAEYELHDIDVDEYEELGEKSVEAAEAGELDRAYLGYAAIAKEDPYNDAALYNLGVLNEIVGNYAEAQDYYQKALGIRQEKEYGKALERSKSAGLYAVSLAAIGASIQRHDFAVSNAALKSATASKVKLEGGSGDRIVIRATANENAATVAKVPGGIELELLEQSGDWFKVKMFDGKVGYVHDNDVR